MQQLVIYETSASELDIIRDISRTFPSHVFFQQRHGPGQRSLYNVLKAYSVFDRDVGYVQVLFRCLNEIPNYFLSMILKSISIAGDGICCRFIASLYERRGCILAIGGLAKRSCSFSNGRPIFGEDSKTQDCLFFIRIVVFH